MGLLSGLGDLFSGGMKGIGGFLHNNLPGLGQSTSGIGGMPGVGGTRGTSIPAPPPGGGMGRGMGLAQLSAPKMGAGGPPQMGNPMAQQQGGMPQNMVKPPMSGPSQPGQQPMQTNTAPQHAQYQNSSGVLDSDGIKSMITAQVQQSQTPISANYFDRMAKIESGYNPNAKSPTGAKGLYQFTKPTWGEFGNGDPMDPVANTNAAIAFANQNHIVLSSRLGRVPLDHELYMAHNLGAGGASRLLNADPNTPVTRALIHSDPSNNPSFLRSKDGGNISARQAISRYSAAFEGQY